MGSDLAGLLRYNRWANLALLQACRDLPPAALEARLDGASGSVRELLLHIAGAQQSLADRAARRLPPPPAGRLNRDSAWPGLDAVAADIERTSNEFIGLMADPSQIEGELEFAFGGERFAYPRRFFLEQAVIHGLEHRTEIKLVLAHQGIDTPDLDGWPWSAADGIGRQLQ